MLGEFGEDRIPRRPIVLTAARLDFIPGQSKPQPADALRLKIGQGARETIGGEFAGVQVDAGKSAELRLYRVRPAGRGLGQGTEHQEREKGAEPKQR